VHCAGAADASRAKSNTVRIDAMWNNNNNVLVERAEANDMYALHINVIDHDIYFQSSNYGPLTANQGPLSPIPAWINVFGGHGHENKQKRQRPEGIF